jgi:hypothetical protein
LKHAVKKFLDDEALKVERLSRWGSLDYSHHIIKIGNTRSSFILPRRPKREDCDS